MSDVKTGAMQQFDEPGGKADQGRAGLVLLYAKEYACLPAAWPLDRRRTVIGRDASADIQLEVNAVSREHAEIVREPGGFVIRDRNSTNGTLIDGALIDGPVLLEPLAEIRVGDAILKFVPEEAEEYAKYRIDGTMVGGTRRQCEQGSALVGGYQMDWVAARIERIARTLLSVMVLGESGTGKEVAARELHRLSGRRGAFCAINCAAIPANLLESELFGYKRGAFSGADRDKPGLIRAAHEGTLLLDEIGDMPLEAQVKLLRALQSKEIWPLGATLPERVDVRVVSATHRDLRGLLQQGRFRSDLYARLNEDQLVLSALRERKEDLFVLLRALVARHGRSELMPSFAFMLGILHYDWPYNVRELEACAKRCVAFSPGPTLTAELLPDPIKEVMQEYNQRRVIPGRSGPSVEEAPAILPRPVLPTEEELRGLLQRHQGNVAAVGRQLGKARMQIHRWMRRYGIQIGEYR